jgi:hypothetical protein
VQAVNFSYVADGRIVGERRPLDLLGVMQQIGAVPERGRRRGFTARGRSLLDSASSRRQRPLR